MAKVSRPVIYAALAAVVVYAAVVLTEPEAPPRKPSVRTKRSASTAENGFTEADLTARFVRYSGRQRDAFSPRVVPRKPRVARPAPKSAPPPAPKGAGIASLGTPGSWALTGITAINGVQSALVENGSTKESLFLKVGDNWNGLRVLAVESNAVVLANALGQRTRLTFEETAPAPRGGATTGAAPAALSAPPAPGATPAAPAAAGDDTALPAAARRRNRRERNLNQP